MVCLVGRGCWKGLEGVVVVAVVVADLGIAGELVSSVSSSWRLS
jgi:hypothetical protein